MKYLLQKLHSRRRSWPDQPRLIQLDETGFLIVETGAPHVRGDWASVHEIFAYKLDLFAYDEICVGLRFGSTGDYWWVGESYVGYVEFLDELARRFPGLRTDWFDDVAQPPFQENYTRLWINPQSADVK